MSNWNYYSEPNLGLLFNKKLYKDVKAEIVYEEGSLKYKVNEKKSEFDIYFDALTNYRYQDYVNPKIQDENVLGVSLKTAYPGLLAGSGYKHETGAQGDAKIGFYFDHTFGTPVIPGSSIKGIIKSVFENESDETDLTSVAAVHFIIDEIVSENKITEDEKQSWIEIKKQLSFPENLNTLKLEIFGTSEEEIIVKGDVFFDAYIDTIYSGVMMGRDFITPHFEDPLKNPKPLMFIKVLPEVPFYFSFKLKVSEKFPQLTNKMKANLYAKILTTFGVGAKTNVGYGQLTEVTPSDIDKWNQKESIAKSSQKVMPGYEAGQPANNKTGNNQPISTNIPPHIQSQIKKGNIFSGKVLEDKGDKFLIEIEVKNTKVLLLKAKDKCDGAVLKDIVDITFNADCSDQPNFKVTKSK